MNRNEILSQIKQTPEVSVLIVGAGINGIGTFRDLALNGAEALLIDRADFCSGASAASSHMAHGGIRYLENGEFRLVREAVAERNRMIRNAPHLVQPLPTVIPIFKFLSGLLNAPFKFLGWLEKPAERGAFIIKVGLMMYDAYTGKTRAVPKHQFYSRAEALRRWEKLHPQVRHAALYYDGLISNPERLALEILLDAEAESERARALNYVSLVGVQNGVVSLRDELTGETYQVRPKLLINAAGAWIDFTNQSLGLSTRYIGGTKGSHIVVDNPELRKAIGENEFFFENKDGRIVLLFPLFDRVLIGTSDINIENPDEAKCSDDEMDYFIGLVGRVFPNIRITREQVVFHFSGVRPLGSSGAKTTAQYSRDHHIEVLNADKTELAFPIYSLVGGKWTSFRAFAEEVTDKALKFLGRTRQKSTRELPIGGGRGYIANPQERQRKMEGIAAWTGIPKERMQTLCGRYGSRAESVAEFISRAGDVALASLPEYSRREIMFLVQHEKVVHLDDLLLRRTMLAMLGRLSEESLRELAAAAGEALGWGESTCGEEIARAKRILQQRHGVNL